MDNTKVINAYNFSTQKLINISLELPYKSHYLYSYSNDIFIRIYTYIKYLH